MKNDKSEIKKGVNRGLLSGFLASLCCLGPLIIVFFSLGSVSFALSLGKYKFVFLSLGFLFMVISILLYFNKKNKTCDVSCFSKEGIKREKYFILGVVSTFIIIYFLIVYVIVPMIAPIVYNRLG